MGIISKMVLSGFPPSLSHSFSPSLTIAWRGIATQPLNIHIPPPPPREFNSDGTPKKYRLTQTVYDHKYDWERWSLMPAGVFHTVYYGEFGRDLPPLLAWLLNYPLAISVIPFGIFCYFVSYVISSMGCIEIVSASDIGVKPKRYTIEWMEASKERDRAENTNPFTRYLDRRRKERGPHWLLEDFMPTHPHFLFIDSYYHDTELLRKRQELKENASEGDDDTDE
ncbi:Cg8 family protein [Cardiosporidium cionae]|uniref:Cg8 family protein n=1 Tax=Cardiosporidium cionae TaxID=476202 RepID=A0ABQ7JC82_9APIC|nr:Cg8 family protein [Cardiosporidium cionae]|eukprot:KAF8821622.1 Cg8 family protein [Cardiosporidium cionae]